MEEKLPLPRSKIVERRFITTIIKGMRLVEGLIP
jgi:hypothetical protein